MRVKIHELRVKIIFIEEEDNRSDKTRMAEEELDGIDIDSIGNFVDLPSL